MEIVNGYPCQNCGDVALAKANIDPARPSDGPNGVNNPNSPENRKREEAQRFDVSAMDPAALADMHRRAVEQASSPYAAASQNSAYQSGQIVNITG